MQSYLIPAASLCVAYALSVNPSQAAPLEAISTTDANLQLFLGAGDLPDDIYATTIAQLGSPFFDSGASSSVDHPDAVTTEAFEMPAGTIFNRGASRTVIGGTAEGVEASYNYEITGQADPDNPFVGVQHGAHGTGRAEAQFSDTPAASLAQSTHSYERVRRLVNQGTDRLSFNITALFSVDLSAEAEGNYTFASSSSNVGLQFGELMGASISVLPFSAYLPQIEEDGIAATVLESFSADNMGFDFSGAAFTASNGVASVATLDASYGASYTVTLEAGGRIDFRTYSQQINQVSTAPVDTPPAVPLPASALLFLSGFAALAGLKRKAAKSVSYS